MLLSPLDLCFLFFALPGVSAPPSVFLGGRSVLSSLEAGVAWFLELFFEGVCSSTSAAPFCADDEDDWRSRLARFLLLLFSSASLFRLLALSS